MNAMQHGYYDNHDNKLLGYNNFYYRTVLVRTLSGPSQPVTLPFDVI